MQGVRVIGVCSAMKLTFGTELAAAATWNHALEPLDKRLSKYIGGNPVRLDGRPRASGVLDTVGLGPRTSNYQRVLRCWQIRSAIANGIPVPREFTEKAVMDIIVSELFDQNACSDVRLYQSRRKPSSTSGSEGVRYF